MSQSGTVVFFTAAPNLLFPSIIPACLDLVGATHAFSVWRSTEVDREWDQFTRSQHEPDVDARADTSELVGTNVHAADVANLYREGTSLRASLGAVPLGRKLWNAVGNAIPESIRGEFHPADPGFTFGGHDIFEWAEHDSGHLFGRAQFSLSLFGYGTPNDWQKYRELVFEIPELVELQAAVARIVGPVERCVFWNV